MSEGGFDLDPLGKNYIERKANPEIGEAKDIEKWALKGEPRPREEVDAEMERARSRLTDATSEGIHLTNVVRAAAARVPEGIYQDEKKRAGRVDELTKAQTMLEAMIKDLRKEPPSKSSDEQTQ